MSSHVCVCVYVSVRVYVCVCTWYMVFMCLCVCTCYRPISIYGTSVEVSSCVWLKMAKCMTLTSMDGCNAARLAQEERIESNGHTFIGLGHW